jgi:hypothetical protein
VLHGNRIESGRRSSGSSVAREDAAGIRLGTATMNGMLHRLTGSKEVGQPIQSLRSASTLPLCTTRSIQPRAETQWSFSYKNDEKAAPHLIRVDRATFKTQLFLAVLIAMQRCLVGIKPIQYKVISLILAAWLTFYAESIILKACTC